MGSTQCAHQDRACSPAPGDCLCSCTECRARRGEIHTHREGPVCVQGEQGEDGCGHFTCLQIQYEWCLPCEIAQQESPIVICGGANGHGYVEITDSGTFTGMAGGQCYWAELSCGCMELDESGDMRAAI